MKKFIIATTLVASFIASALTVQAASTKGERFDGVKFFEDIANRSGG